MATLTIDLPDELAEQTLLLCCRQHGNAKQDHGVSAGRRRGQRAQAAGPQPPHRPFAPEAAAPGHGPTGSGLPASRSPFSRTASPVSRLPRTSAQCGLSAS